MPPCPDQLLESTTLEPVGDERSLRGDADDLGLSLAIQVRDGADLWIKPLPAAVVKGGTAIDSRGRIYVSLENGQLLCFAGS